jgi:hypothetical protein
MAEYQDLLKDTSISVDSGNYFLITITDLDLNQSYPLQFRWKYKDGTYGLWSSSKTILTPGETLPGRPNLAITDVVGGKGFISVTWNGNDSGGKPIANIDRVDIYIDGGIFDGTKPAASFKTSGTQTIAAAAGQYAVTLYAVTNYGSTSPVSLSRTVTVKSPTQEIISPEDPSAPKATAGLASVIVEWDGKRNKGDGTYSDFSAGSFAGAKVFIGTTSDFTPDINNWVHTLNFANGANKVSIGVGTVINKTDNIKLQYGVPYYVKIDTVNADGTANGHPVLAVGNPVTVDKLPASEIKTGFLDAEAYIKAGVSGGARVELSGSTSPFIIYGTDGQTKLLEFIGGSTGTLAINGSGTFTGNLSIGSGDDIFKAQPASGIWLGNALFDNANFSVSKTGYLTAKAGIIAGWSMNGNSLQNSLGTFQIDSGNSRIILGNPDSSHIALSPSSITHYNGPGAPSGKFTLTTANGDISVSGQITGSQITGSTITGSTISLDGLNSYGTFTLTNTLHYGSPSLTWGPTGNPSFEIYQFGGGIGTVINANGILDGGGSIFIEAATKIRFAAPEVTSDYSIQMPSASPDSYPLSGGGIRNIYASQTTLPSAGSYNNGDIVVVY